MLFEGVAEEDRVWDAWRATVKGLDNIDEILAVSDDIMVARGDMGIEIPIQRVFIAQRMTQRASRLSRRRRCSSR